MRDEFLIALYLHSEKARACRYYFYAKVPLKFLSKPTHVQAY